MQQILLIFQNSVTYATLSRPTCLLMSEIFPSEHDFHLQTLNERKKILLHAVRLE